MLEQIFAAFRAEKRLEGGAPLARLQDELAQHAATLISCDLLDLKTLISTLQSLEAAASGAQQGGHAEQQLQAFLRGEESPAAAEAVQ